MEKKLTPKEVLTNRYLYELKCMGLETDEQIEAYLIEQLKIKGIEFND
jgi:hypothetical protein